MKKYELVFEKDNGEDLKVLSFEVYDERFKDYFIDTIMDNLEHDISDLDIDYEDLSSFAIIERQFLK